MGACVSQTKSTNAVLWASAQEPFDSSCCVRSGHGAQSDDDGGLAHHTGWHGLPPGSGDRADSDGRPAPVFGVRGAAAASAAAAAAAATPPIHLSYPFQQ